jgi:hypothetical protein
LVARNGYELVKFFFLLTFSAAIPAIISGGIAERAKFWPQLIATAVIVGLIYPFFEELAWNGRLGVDGRMVWLQRDECPDPGQDLRPGGGQFTDGHGWRYAGGRDFWQQGPWGVREVSHWVHS